MFASEIIEAPTWVDSIPAMDSMLGELGKQQRVAVDTESNSLHAYRERVCLLQCSSATHDYLLDPLALPDLSPVGSLLNEARVEKVFHAAEYDLICLRRDFGFRVRNLFDTMHAARVLGYTALGLDRLLADKGGIQLDKRHQKADWARRPLSAEQIHYARLDTHYLLWLRDILAAELLEKGRRGLAEEDFRRMEAVEVPKARTPGELLRRFKARGRLTASELAVLNELLAWREAEAERLDRPVYKVVNDDMLVELARSSPTDLASLPPLGLSARQSSQWGEAIVGSVVRGLASPPVQVHAATRRDDALANRAERLKRWRQAAAREMGVESDIVLPRTMLLEIATRAPKTHEELATVLRDSPTRLQQHGEQILKALGD